MKLWVSDSDFDVTPGDVLAATCKETTATWQFRVCGNNHILLYLEHLSGPDLFDGVKLLYPALYVTDRFGVTQEVMLGEEITLEGKPVWGFVPVI
ncbi:MAG: hypothetical protein EHM87_23110 [Burkholderiales bacterium]|nr:MAG: hypothetical protein EHM87_23110 [Burkholderiales bacterium]